MNPQGHSVVTIVGSKKGTDYLLGQVSRCLPMGGTFRDSSR
jgi:hypothetical protein